MLTEDEDEQKGHYTFDTVLSNNIKFGKSQIRSYMVISFVDFLEGAEMQFLILLNPILLKQWQFTDMEFILLGSSFNVGIVIGSLICGYSSDKLGRKRIIIYSCLIQVIVNIWVAFVQNLFQLMIIKAIYGLLLGLCLPISQILMTEITPLDKRGGLIVSLQFMYILGKLWTLLLGYFFLDTLSEGNWRAIPICNVIPCLLCFIGSILYLEESPRFQLCYGDFNEGIQGMDLMGITNSANYQRLQEQQIIQLKLWSDVTFKDKKNEVKTSALFNKENLPYTWRAYTISIILVFIFGGIYLILPLILDKEEKTILDLFYTVIIEVPAVILVYCMIDQWGRKPITIVGCACSTVALFIIWYWKSTYLIIGLTLFSFFNRITFLAFIPLIVESFSTLYRAIGVGTTQGIGRIAGIFSPAIIFTMYQYDHYLPFLLSTVVQGVMTLLMLSYPTDLTRKPLDQMRID